MSSIAAATMAAAVLLHAAHPSSPWWQWCWRPLTVAPVAPTTCRERQLLAVHPQRGGGRLQRSGGQPTAGPALCCIFFIFCFVCRAPKYRRTIMDIQHRLKEGTFSCLFLPCAARGARQRFLTVHVVGRRTTKGLHRAKICRVPFVVRLGRKRTAKHFPCVF
jgi:hypothetical protein